MSDLISRQAAIDAIVRCTNCGTEEELRGYVAKHCLDKGWTGGVLDALDAVEDLPSAQPTHPTPSNTLGALDCIDRQEAIKALCREECGMDPKGCHVGTCYDVEIIEDVPSVQLELSNNSPELDNKNGESISRQKAKDAIDMALDHIDHVPPWVYDKLLNALNEVPSAQPRKGKWIDDGTEFGCCCSECNYTLDDYFYGELREVALTKLMNFCPNCGADMRGEQNEL